MQAELQSWLDHLLVGSSFALKTTFEFQWVSNSCVGTFGRNWGKEDECKIWAKCIIQLSKTRLLDLLTTFYILRCSCSVTLPKYIKSAAIVAASIASHLWPNGIGVLLHTTLCWHSICGVDIVNSNTFLLLIAVGTYLLWPLGQEQRWLGGKHAAHIVIAPQATSAKMLAIWSSKTVSSEGSEGDSSRLWHILL